MREVFNADNLEEGAGSNGQGIATIIIYVQMSIYRISSENGLHKYLKNELCASKTRAMNCTIIIKIANNLTLFYEKEIN